MHSNPRRVKHTTKGGMEDDAFSKRWRNHYNRWHKGVRKWIKRKTSKRERRTVDTD